MRFASRTHERVPRWIRLQSFLFKPTDWNKQNE
jgi:hypothetical protein